jgi:hypothetical protein
MEWEIHILQKGLRPLVFRGIVYFPLFLSLLNSTGQAIDGTVIIKAGDYECAIKLPVLRQITWWRIIKSFRILRIPVNQLGEAINTKIACVKVLPENKNSKNDEGGKTDGNDASGESSGNGENNEAPFIQRYLGWRQKGKDKRTKLYYVPFSVRRDFRHNCCTHLRRTSTGRLVIVRRKLEPIEHTLRFRFLESSLLSLILSATAGITNVFARSKTILFYEKFAQKAEEGTFELFQKVQRLSNCQPYFVIDIASPDFTRIQGDGVVPKFSLRYYWLLYRATVFIGTEIPTHLSILRSNNARLRRHLYRGMFIFLQHGITYLKSQSLASSYVKGREGEADYIAVSSEKERDVITRDLHYEQRRILITGLTQFSLLEYQHINDDSNDVVTVMLTWKPYDESVDDSFATSYCQTLLQVVEVVSGYVPQQNLRVIAHPKTTRMLAQTDLEASLWHGPISEALQSTKLLITDYSSVCYNVFYQGGAVIFCQPDLERYEQEVGPLIPGDDEYIGMRTFSTSELRSALANAFDRDGHIVFDTIRTVRHKRNNEAINFYHDGKNIDRIFQALREAGVISN